LGGPPQPPPAAAPSPAGLSDYFTARSRAGGASRARSVGMSSAGRGYSGAISVRVSSSSRLTAQLRYHFRSAGTTYQGASSALLRRSISREASALLLVGDVEEALHDRGGVGRQAGLETGDLDVAAVDLGPREPTVDPRDEDVLVVRPAEHADLPRRRQRPADAPQEVVPGLLLGRLLERGDPAAQRVDEPDDALDRAVLPRRVDALEDEQHRPGLLGPEPLLKAGQPIGVGLQRPPRRFPALHPGVAAGLAAGERVDEVGAGPEQLAQAHGEPLWPVRREEAPGVSRGLFGGAVLPASGRRQALAPAPAVAGAATGAPASIASLLRLEKATATISTSSATPAMVNRAGSLSRRLMM